MAKELINLWYSVSGTLTANASKETKMKSYNLVLIRNWISAFIGVLLLSTWLILSAMHEFLFWEEAIISLGIILCLLLFQTMKQYQHYDSKTNH